MELKNRRDCYINDNMKTGAHDQFLAAFRALVDSAGWGAQARLARALDKTPRHINDIYKGRTGASLQLQEKIADFFGLSYEEMLRKGRELLEGIDTGKTFPYAGKVEHLSANSEARAALIYELTAADHGLTGLHWFTETAIKHARPPGVDAYLNKEIDDAGLYEEAEKEIQRMVTSIEANLEKRKKFKK